MYILLLCGVLSQFDMIFNVVVTYTIKVSIDEKDAFKNAKRDYIFSTGSIKISGFWLDCRSCVVFAAAI